MSRKRFLIAAAISPLLVLPAMALGAVARSLVLLDTPPWRPSDLAVLLFYLPFAYAGEIVIAIPLFFLARTLHTVNLATALVAGVIAAVAVVGLVTQFDSVYHVWTDFLAIGLAGLLSAAAFYYLAGLNRKAAA